MHILGIFILLSKTVTAKSSNPLIHSAYTYTKLLPLKKREKKRKTQTELLPRQKKKKSPKSSRQFLDEIQYPWKLIELVGRLWVYSRRICSTGNDLTKPSSPIAPIFQWHSMSNAWT